MIILGMVAYYFFAVALIAAVVMFAVRQGERKADAAFACWESDLRMWSESTPPLTPRPPVPVDEEPGAEDDPDLNAPALQPITPLLMRVAKEYLDNPNDRERLLRSLTEALAPAKSA